MILVKYILILSWLSFSISSKAYAEVQIHNYRKNYSWKTQWTLFLSEELKKDQFRVGESALLNIEIDEADLDELLCPGYNKASLEDKSDFWVVFFSALTRAESAFNEKARSGNTKGHKSYGLLQLARQTARSQCSIHPPESDVLNPEDNLKCGLKLMSWQLQGAPVARGKKIRADLEGQIFGKYMFQWGPLRQNDFKGRALLVNWFKNHVDQLKFCPKT